MRAAPVVVRRDAALPAPRVSAGSTGQTVIVAGVTVVAMVLFVVWFAVWIGFEACRVTMRIPLVLLRIKRAR